MKLVNISSVYATGLAMLLAAFSACQVGNNPQPSPDETVASGAVTGPLLQYGGAYIQEHATLRIVFWRTSNGLAVSAPTKAAAVPVISATIAGSYFDWLKSEYTTPASLSPTGVSLVPNAGTYSAPIETTSPLTTVISDADIRSQLATELARGNLGSPTDPQRVVLVVMPTGVSVRNIGLSASGSDLPYHDNTYGTASMPYMVVRDDASFASNASAGVISTILNPDADSTFRAWSAGLLSVPFLEVGCFNAGFTVPVRDPVTGTVLPLAPLYSNLMGTCIGPPLQITDVAGTPAPTSQTQSVAPGVPPSPFTYYARNRSAATVGVTSNASCTFAPATLAPGATSRVDCTASSTTQQVTLAATVGATTYNTGMSLTVACTGGSHFDGTTCVAFDCDACACGCRANGRSCERCVDLP